MAKAEIGFSHGAPENRDWAQATEIDGTTYTFTKTSTSMKEGKFLYRCKREPLGPESSFSSNLDYGVEELKQMRQFDNVLPRKK
jgi:hypothetical protein